MEDAMEPGRYVARESMAQWWVQDTEDEMRIICMCPREYDAKMIADALNGPNADLERSARSDDTLQDFVGNT